MYSVKGVDLVDSHGSTVVRTACQKLVDVFLLLHMAAPGRVRRVFATHWNSATLWCVLKIQRTLSSGRLQPCCTHPALADRLQSECADDPPKTKPVQNSVPGKPHHRVDSETFAAVDEIEMAALGVCLGVQ